MRSEIVITGVGMNSLCNFTKYYSCEISLNVNFNSLDYSEATMESSVSTTDLYRVSRKKLTLLNSLSNKNRETFSGNFHMYVWLKVSSI